MLLCLRHERLEQWLVYVAWNAVAMAAILVLSRKAQDGPAWEFAHDWLPTLFFLSVFEEVSRMSLILRSDWQNSYIVAFESRWFPVAPIDWLHRHVDRGWQELLEFGYAAFYPLYPLVAGVLWGFRRTPRYHCAFRRLTDALSIGYALCYTVYLVFPTQSPAHAAAQQTLAPAGSFFGSTVTFLQRHGGVHGNAFPSAHITLAFVVLVFVWRYFPRFAPWLLVLNVLMCAGAVYDGYHYTSDVLAGAVIGIVIGTAYWRLTANEKAAISGGRA